MASQFQILAQRVEALERRMRGAFRQGTVSEVDAGAGTVRLKFGEGDQGDFLSAPIPYAQTAGALRLHSPPSVGQQMIAMSPGGDLRQAVAMPLGFHEGIPSPSSDAASHVLSIGSVGIVLNSSGLTISAGGVSVSITSAGLEITGGNVRHNGTEIGDSHRHSDVMSGASLTGPPD